VVSWNDYTIAINSSNIRNRILRDVERKNWTYRRLTTISVPKLRFEDLYNVVELLFDFVLEQLRSS